MLLSCLGVIADCKPPGFRRLTEEFNVNNMKILSYQPHQKIRYSGGLISLVLLPILYIGWMANHSFFRVNGIGLVTDSFRFQNGAYNLNGTIPHRNYTSIYITADSVQNEIKLTWAKNVLHQLKATNDTLRGIKFIFDKSCNYKYFVKTIDICHQEIYPFYFTKTDHILAFHSAKQHFDYTETGDCLTSGRTEEQISLFNNNKRIPLVKKFATPALAFVLLILLSALSFYKTHIVKLPKSLL